MPSECNLCRHRRRIREAKRDGEVVTLLSGEHGWTDYYVHPPFVDVKKMPWLREKYRRGAYMSLPDRCCC